MELLERFPRQRDDLAARVIGGEAVVVTPADSLVHELDPVATYVWEKCDGRRSGWEIVESVVAAFEVERSVAARDLEILLRTLSDKGLVDLLAAARSE